MACDQPRALTRCVARAEEGQRAGLGHPCRRAGSSALPPDLEARLAKGSRARRAFEKLDSRNRYAILYRLHDAKRPETRQRRLEQFVAMLEGGRTIH